MAGNTGKFAQGAMKKETTYGTAVVTDRPLSMVSEDLNYVRDSVEDGRQMGKLFTSRDIKVGSKVEGGMNLTFHPQEAGHLFNAALGTNEAVVDPPAATVFVWYTGSENYASLMCSSSTLYAEVGATSGTASADTNFNTTGSIDLTNASFDTATELATAIDGYTGWEAEYVGLSSADTGNIADFSETALEDGGVNYGAEFLFCSPSSTDSKRHHIEPAAATSSLPSYTMDVDRTVGASADFRMAGYKFSTFELAVDAKGIVTFNFSGVGKLEDATIDFPSLTLEDDDPFIATNYRIWINRIECTDVKNLSVSYNQNLDLGEVVGSEYIAEPMRQGGEITISGTANLTTGASGTSQHRSLFTGDTVAEIIIYCEHSDYSDTANEVYNHFLIRIPNLKFTEYNFPITGPDRITINIAGKAQASGKYEHMEIDVVDKNTSTY